MGDKRWPGWLWFNGATRANKSILFAFAMHTTDEERAAATVGREILKFCGFGRFA